MFLWIFTGLQSPDGGRCSVLRVTGLDREAWTVDTHGPVSPAGTGSTAAHPPVETTLLHSATAAELPTPGRLGPCPASYSGIPRARAMSIAAAAAASASASPSSRSSCFTSPATAARRRFLHHLLAAPPRPPQLRRCSPYHWMAQFWTEGSLEKNNALVEYLKQYGVVRTDQVAEVMETIDRALFVPKGFTPYIDSPMPIGYNATISAPHMHATCLELLKDHLQPGMHALDVGSGSGYLTACFALMVGPEGRAVGIEHIPELVAASIENVERSAAAPLLKDGSLSFHVSDGRLGWPDTAPYDAIHVGAAAPVIPQPLLEQLKPGGRMVIPVGTYSQDLQVIDKNADGSTSVRNDASVRYVPLTSRSAQLQDP